MPVRVLVVDDTAFYRRAVSEALAGIPGVEVAGTAANGSIALSRIESLQPDLLTLDVEMPGITGLEVLESIAGSARRPGAIMLSSHTPRGGRMTVRALELGAFDFIAKPEGAGASMNLVALREQLASIIRAFERHRQVRTLLTPEAKRVRPIAAVAPAPPPLASRRRPSRGSPVVLIGVSTGGPAALATLLPTLPADLGAPVLIVQHMPPMFTQPLAESLARKCLLPVKEAEDGETAGSNCVYIAPGGRHMKIEAGPAGALLLRLTDDPPEHSCRPAVDCLFRSAALQAPGRAVAVILTGMGQDGTAGLRLLKRSGCHSIAQDEASCVVFGMPREAIHAGLVDSVEPLDRIARAIVRYVREDRA